MLKRNIGIVLSMVIACLFLLAFPYASVGQDATTIDADGNIVEWNIGFETWIPLTGSIIIGRLNTANGVGVDVFLEGQMVWVDLVARGVPVDTIAVDVTGMLLLTHGTTAGTCDIRVTLDSVNQDEQPYIGQALEAHLGGGQRSNMSATGVPLDNGFIGVRWDRVRTTTGAEYPTDCAYGFNLVVTKVTR